MRKIERKLEALAEFALSEAKGAGADFLTFIGGHSRSVRDRVVGGQVLQPKDREESWIQLVLWKNGRVKADSVYPERGQIKKEIHKMLAVIRRDEFPQSDLVTPEGPHKGGYDARLAKKAYDFQTAELSSKSASKIILTAKHLLEKENLILDGVLTQNLGTVLVAATHGTRQAHASTSAGFSLYAFDRSEAESLGKARLVSAFSYSGGNSINDINAEDMSKEAIIKCNLQRTAGSATRKKWNPFAKCPNFTGEKYFDVIVEPPFIGPVLTWLFGYGGFNGKFYLQGESFLSGRLGNKVFGENVTIWDDPFNPRGIVNPFDWEGVPKRKIRLVHQGVLENICYDTTLAKLAGARSTGHALPAAYAMAWGTAPENVYVEGGNYSIGDMIKESKKPTIWITKEHYLGLKHFQTGTITGTAQHGVFLVKDGEVIKPVENLRFEMKIPEALNRVTHLGEPALIGGLLGGESPYVVPPMRIEGFRFIGATGRTK